VKNCGIRLVVLTRKLDTWSTCIVYKKMHLSLQCIQTNRSRPTITWKHQSLLLHNSLDFSSLFHRNRTRRSHSKVIGTSTFETYAASLVYIRVEETLYPPAVVLHKPLQLSPDLPHFNGSVLDHYGFKWHTDD
jgi:hypothetical protein